jgi:hypothetical protein
MMTTGPASLDNLRPLALPAPVPWFPPQPGWWILLAALLACLSLGIWRLAKIYRANAYRRAALSALQTLSHLPPTEMAPALAALLKRTALAAYPRALVAGLTGPAWQQFLSGTEPLIQTLRRATLTTQPLTQAEAATALQSAALWIRRHKAPP